MNLIASAIQMDTSLTGTEINVSKAERYIRNAASAGAKIVVVPELFNTGYRLDERYMEYSENLSGPTIQRMEAIARDADIFIAGSIVEKDTTSDVLFDTAFLVSPQGFVGYYRKVHRWGREPEFFASGAGFPVFETPWGQVGLIICYDVGFPEAARSLALAGANIILIPSAFGMPRLYAWDLATRARALENGCFLVASNRIGSEKDSVFCGHSRIVDPQGTVIVDAGIQEAVILASLDLSEVSAQRQRIPYLKDRKPEVYRDVSLNSLAAHPSPVAVQEADNFPPTVMIEKLG